MTKLDEISKIIYSIGKDVKIVAASKYANADEISKLVSQGQLDFGENKVQDMSTKVSQLSHIDINWHFIGRLQTNKINQLISLKPHLWQSCNSLQKAIEVDKRLNYRLDTLLQINSANEESKQGIAPELAIFTYEEIQKKCKNINLIGVMSIGANSTSLEKVITSFKTTRKIFDSIPNAKICSMGMSSDYKVAIEYGSNMIRLGSILFK